MRTTGLTTLTVALAFALAMANAVRAGPAWTSMGDPGEVRALITGKTVVMYTTRIQYYGGDGNMVEYFSGHKSYIVRKWKLTRDARLCWMVFTMPDRVIDCARIQRIRTPRIRYRFLWLNVKSTPPLEIGGKPSKELLDALIKKAGRGR